MAPLKLDPQLSRLDALLPRADLQWIFERVDIPPGMLLSRNIWFLNPSQHWLGDAEQVWLSYELAGYASVYLQQTGLGLLGAAYTVA